MTEEVTNQGTVNQQQETSKGDSDKMRNIKGLEDIVDTLTEDVVKALDIKEEKKRLIDKIRRLRHEEMELKEVVGELKGTRDKLAEELNKRNENISILQSKIDHLKEDRAKLSTDKVSLKEQIKNLEIEKDQMTISLDKTNDMLTKLKHQIESFDEEIKG